MGLNGGTVGATHDVTSAVDLVSHLYRTAEPRSERRGRGRRVLLWSRLGMPGSHDDDSLSFATISPIRQTEQLVALYGDISDSTFDGTSTFGAPPTGAWTATNDFYVYHGAECSSFGVASGIAGPGDYYAAIPSDATHLLSVPLSGNSIDVATQQVYQPFSGVTLAAGDCLVTLWGVQGGGAFDNETQVTALVSP